MNKVVCYKIIASGMPHADFRYSEAKMEALVANYVQLGHSVELYRFFEGQQKAEYWKTVEKRGHRT